MKILVINRRQEVIGHIQSVLASVNPTIRHYDSGFDGLLAGRVEQFDLMLVGTDLPVITGFELVRSLRHSSVNKTTSVVFLTDEINQKATYLSSLLGAIALMHENDTDKLKEILQSQIKKHEANRASELSELFQVRNLN